MALKFSANISWLFKEAGDMPARCIAAKSAGFSYIEAAYPYDTNIDILAKTVKDNNLKVALINCYQGDVSKGEAGIAALSSHTDVFKTTLKQSVDIAKKLECKRLHIMSGLIPNASSQADVNKMEINYLENLKYAADILSKDGIQLLIEPINNTTVPQYFLNDVNKAVDIIKTVNHPNIYLQADLFHWQIIHGNLTYLLRKYIDLIGHIQIAQVPGRGEPSSAGEINYDYIFQLLVDLGYNKHVGCEYKPTRLCEDTLGWMEKWVE